LLVQIIVQIAKFRVLKLHANQMLALMVIMMKIYKVLKEISANLAMIK
jgi:hypothetical protein